MQYPRRKTDLVLEAHSGRNSEHGGGVGGGGGGGGGREDLDCQSWWWSRRLRRPSVPNVRRVSGEVYCNGQGFHMDNMLERPTFPLVSFISYLLIYISKQDQVNNADSAIIFLINH